MVVKFTSINTKDWILPVQHKDRDPGRYINQCKGSNYFEDIIEDLTHSDHQCKDNSSEKTLSLVPAGLCNIRVDGPNGLKKWRFEIEGDKINQAADEIIDGWLNVEKEYVAYVDAICDVDSVVGNEQTIPCIPDDPDIWVEHKDTELKCSKIPDDILQSLVKSTVYEKQKII